MAKVKTGPKTKRKGGGIPAKAKAVDGLQSQLERSKAIIVTEYRGLTVAELQDLRRKLRPKGVIDETKTFKMLKIVGGFLSGRAMSADDVAALAKLPSKLHLQATLVGSLTAPLAQTVAVLQAPLAQLIRVLNAKAQA